MTDISGEADLPPPTLPQEWGGIDLSGFPDIEAAKRFGDIIGGAIQFVSRFIDLELLDRVAVAFDYDGALANIDRGDPSLRPLTRTGTDELAGVAMSPVVVRDGRVKSHMVFWAPCVLGLGESPDSELFQRAMYIVAHEAGHVEDLKHRSKAFPDSVRPRPPTNFIDAILEQVSACCWEEYAACRTSAQFGRNETAIYEVNFTSVLGVARDQANAAIREYRLHADLYRVMSEAGPPLVEPLRTAAYLFGHLDGLDETLENAAPNAASQLAASSYSPFVSRLQTVLRDLWSARELPQSPSQSDQLKQIGHDVIAYAGLILRRMPDGGAYIDIPFTADTTPAVGRAEQHR